MYRRIGFVNVHTVSQSPMMQTLRMSHRHHRHALALIARRSQSSLASTTSPIVSPTSIVPAGTVPVNVVQPPTLSLNAQLAQQEQLAWDAAISGSGSTVTTVCEDQAQQVASSSLPSTMGEIESTLASLSTSSSSTSSDSSADDAVSHHHHHHQHLEFSSSDDAVISAAITASPTQGLLAHAPPFPMETGHPNHMEFGIANHSLADASGNEVAASLRDSFICPPAESMWHIQQIQDVLGFLHDSAGLPWWASIMAVTVTVRTILIPLNISLVRNSARLNVIRPRLEQLGDVLRAPGVDDDVRREAAVETGRLFREHKCSPFKNVLSPIFMTPVFLSVFMAWERMVVFTPSCQSGGALWFENLAAVDVTYLLPVLSALTWIWTFRLGADRVHSPNAGEFERFASYMSLAMIPVTQTLPQGVFLFWLTSNFYSMAFMLLTRRPRVRKMLGIPPVMHRSPSTLQQPQAGKAYNWE